MVFLIEVFKTEKKDLEMSRLSNLISHHFFFFLHLLQQEYSANMKGMNITNVSFD